MLAGAGLRARLRPVTAGKLNAAAAAAPVLQKISTAEPSRAGGLLHAIPSLLSHCEAGFQFTVSDMIENDVATHLLPPDALFAQFWQADSLPATRRKQAQYVSCAEQRAGERSSRRGPSSRTWRRERGFPGIGRHAQTRYAGRERRLPKIYSSSFKLKPAVFDFPVEFRKDDATFQEGLAKLGEQAQFAAAINCPRMVTYIMPSSDTPKAELRATYKQRFSESAKVLAESNVRLGLEFLGPLQFRKQFKYEFIWQMNEMLEFAEECGPNVGLLLDAWHWHQAGATTAGYRECRQERIVHVHFNDAPNLPPDQIRDNHRLLPGEGVIDLTGFLQTLQKIGYRDALSVEVFGRRKTCRRASGESWA